MLTIGTRGSALALAQTRWVAGMILARYPDAEIKIEVIKTSADKDLTTSIRSGTATGVFVKEIEEAVLSSEIDMAVHSMKDLPTKIPEALEIGAIPQREDAHDALISGAEWSPAGRPAARRSDRHRKRSEAGTDPGHAARPQG